MKLIYAFRGLHSQTGLAVTKRFPEAQVEPFEQFEQIKSILARAEDATLATPVWNSHEGEIPKTFVWDHLLDSNCRLVDLWPIPIQFWLVSRQDDIKKIRTLCSVSVASRQCSVLLAQLGCKFVSSDSTIEAFDRFRDDVAIDAVLIAPGHPGAADFEILSRETADPNNFTSFVLVAPPNSSYYVDSTNRISGISMPVLTGGLTESQRDLFTQLFRNVRNLAEVPRPVFVFDRSPSTVGLLFEGRQLLESDILSATESELGDIQIHEKLGSTAKPYSKELLDLLSDSFPQFLSSDFVLHVGKNACLFGCPPLGIFTHGYSVETVEAVIKFYILQLFSLWSDGLICKPHENAFFEKYEERWIDEIDFIEFARI